MAVVQHGHHCIHAPEHFSQHLVLVRQGEAGWDVLGKGVVPLVCWQLSAEGRKTRTYCCFWFWRRTLMKFTCSLTHSPVLDFCLPLCALLCLLLLNSSLGSSCKLFGSNKGRTEGFRIADRGFGWFRCKSSCIISCWTSRGGRRTQFGTSDRSTTGFLATLLNPLKTRLKGCNVLFRESLKERMKTQKYCWSRLMQSLFNHAGYVWWCLCLCLTGHAARTTEGTIVRLESVIPWQILLHQCCIYTDARPWLPGMIVSHQSLTWHMKWNIF